MAHDRAGYRDHCRECRHFMIDAWLMQIRRYAYGVGAPAAYYCDALRGYVNASDSPQNPIKRGGWMRPLREGKRHRQ